MRRFLGVFLLAICLSGCAVPAGPAGAAASSGTTEAAEAPQKTVTPSACQLDPVDQPPWPVKTLRPNEYDRQAGLHMTGKPQRIDLATYRLKVTGRVEHLLSLTYDQLRCLPRLTANPDLVCPGDFVDEATWTGVPLKVIVELAGVHREATQLTLISADGYQVTLPLELATADGNFLAYELKGKPLPVQHGFPLRAVFPTLQGSKWIKWLLEIRIN